jgi:peroxiredoxin
LGIVPGAVCSEPAGILSAAPDASSRRTDIVVQERRVGLLEIAVLLAWIAVLLGLWAIVQLTAQNGRLLLRVEALERHLGDLVGLSATSFTSEPTPDSDADDAITASEPGVPTGTVLHDFELPDLSGHQRLRSEWLGQRLLMIFVSPYCRHSRALLPDLAALRSSAPATWPLPLLVSTGSPDENRRLFQRIGLGETVLVQEEMEVGALFEVAATPTAYLVDEDGKTASPLVAGRAAILGLAATTTTLDRAPGVEPASWSLIEAETTPAPVNGSRYKGGLERESIAPSFRLTGLDGQAVGLDQFRGARVLVVFSDPIHPPCGELAERLERLHRTESVPKIVVVSRGDPESNRAWAAEHGLTLTIGLQERWDVSREYGLLAVPVAYLVDERGTVAAPVAIGADEIVELAESARGA